MPQSKKHRYRKGFLRWSKTLGYEPPGLSLLATLAKQTLEDQCYVQVIDEMVTEFNPELIEADLVGITVITPTAKRAYDIAKVLRSRKIPVILGGRHVTLCPNEAQNYADAIVIGRAEQAWPRLLKDFIVKKLQPRYVGSSQNFGQIIPDRQMTSCNYITKNTVQSSIGCPFSCSFCVVPKTQSDYVHANSKKLIAEIESFSGKTFLDLSLSPMEQLDDGFLKAYLTDLAALNKRWGGLSTAQALENETLFKLLVKSGFRGVLIGLESLSKKSLQSIGKGFNKPERYLELIRKLHDHGIMINGCFIFGSDEDDTDVFDRTLDFVFKAGIDLPRFAVLTPFPGTPLFARLKQQGRILHHDWSRFDTQNVVYQPQNMTTEQLARGLKYAWKQAYSFTGIAKRMFKSMAEGTLTMFPVSMAANLGYVGYSRFPSEVPQPCERR